MPSVCHRTYPREPIRYIASAQLRVVGSFDFRVSGEEGLTEIIESTSRARSEELPDPRTNRLLSRLTPGCLAQVEAMSELVALTRDTVVESVGITARHVYFPIDSLFATTVVDDGGRTAQAAMLGSREATGLLAIISVAAVSPVDCHVVIAGSALRADLDRVRHLFESNAEFRGVILMGVQLLLVQLSQNTACFRLHSLEQRYARWILDTNDRIGRSDLALTHDAAASLLGVRRAGLTGIANEFERRGLISKRRSMTTVSNREALEATSCGCYRVTCREYARMFPDNS